jgi:CelD/BcsL family acetyltransferase involved in cellulose biosynthesis
MRLNTINPSVDERWNQFVMDHPLGCIFHHSAWKEVLDQSFSHLHPCYFIIENDTGNIIGGVPCFIISSRLTGKRMVSLPFSLYCDPLVTDESHFRILLDYMSEYMNKSRARFIELRTRFAYNLFENTEYKQHTGYKNHTLILQEDYATIRKTFHRSCVRQKLQHAENSGIHVRRATSEEDVRIFYHLNCLTRKKFGVPPKSPQFYLNLWEILHPKNMVEILIAEYQNEFICSVLLLKYKKYVHAEYMGTDDRFIRMSPNILLFGKAIELAYEEGYGFFDFGSSASSNTSLIQFKQRWGTKEEDISHFYFPEVRGFSCDFENSWRYRLFTGVNRRLPDPLFRYIGKQLYNHLGG